MSYPPPLQRTDQQNLSPTRDDHPNDHAGANSAINTIRRVIGGAGIVGPYGADDLTFDTIKDALTELFERTDELQVEVDDVGSTEVRNTVRSGTGAPSPALGNNGDFYIDRAAYNIYGPKTGGAWGSPTSIIGPAGADGADGEGTGVEFRDEDNNDVTSPTLRVLGAPFTKVGSVTTLDLRDFAGGGGGGGGLEPVEPIESLNYPSRGTSEVGYESGTPAQSPNRAYYFTGTSASEFSMYNDDDLDRYEGSFPGSIGGQSPAVTNSGALLVSNGVNTVRYYGPGNGTGTVISARDSLGNAFPSVFFGGMFFGGDGFGYIGVPSLPDPDGDYRRLTRFDLDNPGAGGTNITDYQGMLAASGFTVAQLKSSSAFPALVAAKSNSVATWALINTAAGEYKMVRRENGTSTWSVIFGNFDANNIAGFKVSRPGAGDSFVWGTIFTGEDPDTGQPLNTYGVRKLRGNGTVVSKADLTPGSSSAKGELAAKRFTADDTAAFGNVVELEEDYYAIITAVATDQYDAPPGRSLLGVQPMVWLINATTPVITRQPFYVPESLLVSQTFNDSQPPEDQDEEVLYAMGAAADTTPDGTRHRVSFTYRLTVGGLISSQYSTDQVLLPTL